MQRKPVVLRMQHRSAAVLDVGGRDLFLLWAFWFMFAGPENAGAPEEPEALPPVGPEEPSEPAFAGVLQFVRVGEELSDCACRVTGQSLLQMNRDW